MPSFKIHSAEVRRYGEPAIIITTADNFNARLWRSEYYVLIPDDPDEANALIARRLDFEVEAFQDSPIVLNEEFVLNEALVQARIDLNLYLRQHADQDKFIVLKTPTVVESDINALIGPRMRGTFPQIEDVYRKTRSSTLENALKPLGYLPRAVKMNL